MITSLNQAQSVQTRRVNQSKYGVAKAVRRYLLREHASNYKDKKVELPSLVSKKHQ